QTTNDEVLATFRNAAEHLSEGGIFLFDVWYGPAVLSQRPEVRVKRIDGNQTRLTRIAEPQLLPSINCVDVCYDVFVEDLAAATHRRLVERHRMRYFTTPEIAWLAGLSSFDIVQVEEWLTGQEPSLNTWGVCYILRRRNT